MIIEYVSLAQGEPDLIFLNCEEGVSRMEFIGISADKQQLDGGKEFESLLIGKELNYGLGFA